MPQNATAPIFTGNGQIELQQRSWPDPDPGQLLIRVRANAICGTDRHQFLEGSVAVAGHETAGEVVAVGKNTSQPIGARGVIFFKDYCGHCRSCLATHTSLCFKKKAMTGFDSDGGYGPYELISETQFYPIPDDLPFDLATMLLDAMGTTGHAWDRAISGRKDITSVYIAGAGPIGLGLLVMGKIKLSEDVPIYISDISPWRRSYAEKLGGIPVDANDVARIRELAPIDVSFDSTGKEVARQLAIDVLGHRGVFMVVGGQEGFSFTDVGQELLPRELSILGSEYFDYREFAANVAILQKNRELISKLVTHTFPIDKLDLAFATFLSGEAGKVVVTQQGDPT